MKGTNKNCIHEEIMNGLNLVNASVQNPFVFLSPL